MGNTLLEHGLRLGIGARNRIANNGQVRSRHDMLRAKARKDIDADIRQVSTHGRIDVLIRTRHPVAA